MGEAPTTPGAFDRLASFRVVYAGIFAYVVVSIAVIEITEALLDRHFKLSVSEVSQVSPADGPVVPQIQRAVRSVVRQSGWVRIGGVRVSAIVLGADGHTPIYLEGSPLNPPPLPGDSPFEEAERLLPVMTTVNASVPLDSLLAGSVFVAFGAILIPLLFVHSRRMAQREDALLQAAVAARDVTADRARSIQAELERVRARLVDLEPTERALVGEVGALEGEREALQAKLRELEEREEDLRLRASRASDLEQERTALEELLDEAVRDLDSKEGEIRELEDRLKKASPQPSKRSRSRSAEQLGRRLRTLYSNLEIEDRALDDMVALGDESLRLRAEEGLKKLDADPESAGTRRKVGGLPGHLSIFELGFAGKGRIYYSRGAQRPFRILAIGGKASQKADLEYLSRLKL